MKIDHRAIAMKMSELASDVARIEVDVGWEPGVHSFYAYVPAELPVDTVMSLCRRWAKLIRKFVPDRSDDWSSKIAIGIPSGAVVGDYHIGWLGREDTWMERDWADPPDSEEWEALYRRLDAYLGTHGKSDSQAKGDYFLYDEESGYADHNLTIYRLEFLTHELVNGIQDILRDGYADWIVYVTLDLQPPVTWTSSDGLEIYADRIVEKWNRALIASVLGERLKI